MRVFRYDNKACPVAITSQFINRISWSGGAVRVRAGGATHALASRGRGVSRAVRGTGRDGGTVKQELYLYANITSQPTPVCVFSALGRFAAD